MLDDMAVLSRIAPDLMADIGRRAQVLSSIESMQPVGRRALAARLNMPEREVRAAAAALKDQGLISMDAAGMQLTPRAIEVLSGAHDLSRSMFGLTKLEQTLSGLLNVPHVIVVSGNVDADARDVTFAVGKKKWNALVNALYDALYQLMGPDSYQSNMEKGLIEVAPLAYMRGRTLDNAFIILDEAQNTTPAQMKMFLTRIGFGSKVVVTGDATQKDLAPGTVSGLDVALKVLGSMDEIGFCMLTSKDVVRHPLVQKIVKRYEDYENKHKPGDRKHR